MPNDGRLPHHFPKELPENFLNSDRKTSLANGALLVVPAHVSRGDIVRRRLSALIVLLWVTVAGPYLVQPARAADTCKTTAQKGRVSKIFGGLGEGLLSAGMGRIGIRPDTSYRGTVRDLLSNGMACALTDGELQKAQSAQGNALNSKKIGSSSTATWTSPDRPGVTGGTTVVSRSVADGRSCAVQRSFFTDADGKETSTEKELCQNPDGSSWVPA